MNILSLCMPCLWLREEDDPERRPLFPPPNTILTPPRPRHQLPLASSTASTDLTSGQISPNDPSIGGVSLNWSTSGLDDGSRERIGSISRAYQGRMLPVTQRSLPASTASSAAPTPAHTRLHFFKPHRPAAPEMGRSISEPRSLFVLAQTSLRLPDFAPHQIPQSHSVEAIQRRTRSATNAEEILGLYPRRGVHAEELQRGRSPGTQRIVRSASVDLLSSLSGGTKGALSSEAASGADEDVEVNHRTLGLGDLGRGHPRRGSRGRNRPGRGKDIRRVTS